ncbi:MAG: hypothetical protein WCK86_20360, partial [Planctomycetia bacterium]
PTTSQKSYSDNDLARNRPVRPVTPADVHATIFHALGYRAQQLTYHHSDGRPAPVCDGQPISELL